MIRDGLIAEIALDAKPPADARVWDLAGKTVYAGFIDAYSRYSLAPADAPAPLRPEKPSRRKTPSDAGSARSPGAAAWNPFVTPQRDAACLVNAEDKKAEERRALGFVDALVVPGRGISCGQSALVDLTGEAGEWARLMLRRAIHRALEHQGPYQDGRERHNCSNADQ